MPGQSSLSSAERLDDAARFYGRPQGELRIAAANLDDGWPPTPEEVEDATHQDTIGKLARSAWVATITDGDHLL